MNNIAMELYTAWKKGMTEIVIDIQDFNELLMLPHTDNENVNYEDHAECPSPMHEIDMITELAVLKTRHYATYRDTLKIMVKKKVDNNL